jgi:hypothetical protein
MKRKPPFPLIAAFAGFAMLGRARCHHHRGEHRGHGPGRCARGKGRGFGPPGRCGRSEGGRSETYYA